MFYRKKTHWLSLALTILTFGLVLGDGNETLAPPATLPGIASGTGVVAGGTGLFPDGIGSIALDVPQGANVKQVLLYWEGEWSQTANFNRILVNGQEVTGTLIGQTTYLPDAFATSFRADITSLGVIAPGTNSVSLELVAPFDIYSNGATILVILDDGSESATIDLRDGHDWAFREGTIDQLDVTQPQTFTFPASSEPRTGTLVLVFGSAQSPALGCGSGTGNVRPNVIEVTVGDTTYEIVDPMVNTDGDYWDTLIFDPPIPPGVTTLTVQAFSEDRGEPSPCLVASFGWVLATLSVPPAEEQLGAEGCSPGFWKNHVDSWASTGYSPNQAVGTVFNVSAGLDEIAGASLLGALQFGGGPGTSGGARILLRAAVAALLNASHPDVPYALSSSQVISRVNAALASGDRSTMLALAEHLDRLNNAGCELN